MFCGFCESTLHFQKPEIVIILAGKKKNRICLCTISHIHIFAPIYSLNSKPSDIKAVHCTISR